MIFFSVPFGDISHFTFMKLLLQISSVLCLVSLSGKTYAQGDPHVQIWFENGMDSKEIMATTEAEIAALPVLLERLGANNSQTTPLLRLQYAQSLNTNHVLAVIWLERNDKEWLIYLSEPKNRGLFVRSIRRSESDFADVETLAYVLKSLISALLSGDTFKADLLLSTPKEKPEHFVKVKKDTKTPPPTSKFSIALGGDFRLSKETIFVPGAFSTVELDLGVLSLFGQYGFALASITQTDLDSNIQFHTFGGGLVANLRQDFFSLHAVVGLGATYYSTQTTTSNTNLESMQSSGWSMNILSLLGLSLHVSSVFSPRLEFGLESHPAHLNFKREDVDLAVLALGFSPMLRFSIFMGF